MHEPCIDDVHATRMVASITCTIRMLHSSPCFSCGLTGWVLLVSADESSDMPLLHYTLGAHALLRSMRLITHLCAHQRIPLCCTITGATSNLCLLGPCAGSAVCRCCAGPAAAPA